MSTWIVTRRADPIFRMGMLSNGAGLSRGPRPVVPAGQRATDLQLAHDPPRAAERQRQRIGECGLGDDVR